MIAITSRSYAPNEREIRRKFRTARPHVRRQAPLPHRLARRLVYCEISPVPLFNLPYFVTTTVTVALAVLR